MGVQEIRLNQNMSRRELAQKAGINFRSLQDYEQGHKKLSSVCGDVILRLSIVLSCSAEELLLPDDFPGAPLLSDNTVDIEPAITSGSNVTNTKPPAGGSAAVESCNRLLSQRKAVLPPLPGDFQTRYAVLVEGICNSSDGRCH